MSGSLWQGVLSRVRGSVTEQQFDTWFRTVEPAHCTDDVLELMVPNTFSREWLRKKYADLILGAAAAATGGRRPTLRITVREGGEPDEGAAIATAIADPEAMRKAIVQDPILVENVQPARPRPRASSSVATPRTGAWLNPDYRFDTLVVGGHNRLASAAAMAVVDKGHRVYNPLVVHGGVGLGKSHVLQAICRAWSERRPDDRVRYVPSESFINQFISAVDEGDLDRFRRKYREVDLLVVDDVQFLAGKERTQEEFFHTFNHLHQLQKQIVLSSDVSPREIEGLSERLASRFRWGMVCEIETPSFETRLDLVRQKSEQLGELLPDGVASLIAEHVRTHVRELEGAVTRVIGHAHLSGQDIDLQLAREALKDVVVERRRRVTIQHIAEAVTRRYDVKLSELQSKKRAQVVAVPRQVCMFLARRLTGHSLEEIGGFFGGRDHSTVLYGVDRIRKRASEDEGLREAVEELAAEALTIAAS